MLSAIFVQTDKIVLSKMLSLEYFGHYTLAASLAIGGMFIISSPIFSAIYPRLAQLVVVEAEEDLSTLYHKGCQLMAVFVMPLSFVTAFFSTPLLEIWTQDPILSSQVSPIICLLMFAAAFGALRYLPYALQLAHGWTKLTLISNIFAIVALLSGLTLIVPKHGALGGAAVLLSVNAGYTLVNVFVMHLRLLKGEVSRWFIQDVFVPSIAAFLVVFTCWAATPPETSALGKVVCAVFAGFVAMGLSALSATSIREGMATLARSYRDKNCRKHRLLESTAANNLSEKVAEEPTIEDRVPPVNFP